jgi:hypothetical protein
MTLVPGNNTLPMTSIIEPAKLLAAKDASGMITMMIAGQYSVFNGQHLTYYVCIPQFSFPDMTNPNTTAGKSTRE